MIELHGEVEGLEVESDHLAAGVPERRRVDIRRVDARSLRVHAAELPHIVIDPQRCVVTDVVERLRLAEGGLRVELPRHLPGVVETVPRQV